MKKIHFLSIATTCALLFTFTTVTAFAAEKTYTNSIGIEFVLIPSGSFMMGTDPNFEEGDENEWPQHKVTISKPFYLGKYEVTQAQWVSVMGSNPSYHKGRNNPVERVSWQAVQEFIRRLNAKEGHNRYRLPTEAEWEYATRAGTSSAFFFGDDWKELAKYAWYGDMNGSSHPVGQKPANAWGLHDVHGNVNEWVQDWYGENYYASSPGTAPKGPTNGSYRVVRGGSWGGAAWTDNPQANYARRCRSGYRNYREMDTQSGDLGFRLLLSLE